DKLFTTATSPTPALWQFDGAVWTKIDGLDGFATRDANAFASTGSSFVGFGGVDHATPDGALNETFVWSGSKATSVPADGPPADDEPLLAPLGSQLVLVTGHTGYTTPQTWHWNGS